MGVISSVDLLADLPQELVLLGLAHRAFGLLFCGLLESLVSDFGLKLRSQRIFFWSSVESGVILGGLGDGSVGVSAAARPTGVV